jgi:Ca-activated chloride channel homolog
VDVTVTDPFGRFVTGLNQGNFEVIENGVGRTITSFRDAGSPIAVAVISEEPLPAVGTALKTS